MWSSWAWLTTIIASRRPVSRRDVVEHGRQRADVAADMDPAVDEHVLVVGEAHEEAVAEPDPVHPDPDRGGASSAAAGHRYSPLCTAARLKLGIAEPR